MMTQEEKDLLLKDLCGRLPYGVKILHQGWNYEWDQERSTLERVTGIDERFIYTKVIDDNGEEYTSDRHTISLCDDKPYLFPLSSMTAEQTEEVHNLIYQGVSESVDETSKWLKTRKENELRPITLTYILSYKLVIDWFCKNHFDYRGLIPMGLAIDATGLNIY